MAKTTLKTQAQGNLGENKTLDFILSINEVQSSAQTWPQTQQRHGVGAKRGKF